MFTEALFLIASNWKHIQVFITDRMNKLWYVHSMEHIEQYW